MSFPKRTVVAISIALAIWIWVLSYRSRDRTMFQLNAIAHAFAAYCSSNQGSFPNSMDALEKSGLAQRDEHGSVTIICDPVEDFPWYTTYYSSIVIDDSTIKINWSNDHESPTESTIEVSDTAEYVKTCADRLNVALDRYCDSKHRTAPSAGEDKGEDKGLGVDSRRGE